MREFTVRTTIRLDPLPGDDRASAAFDALAKDASIMGPSMTTDLVDSTVSVLTDVEAASLEEAQQIAREALERALAGVGVVAHRP